jgi:sulfhydrogenase subunit beta (sulfur reductase)
MPPLELPIVPGAAASADRSAPPRWLPTDQLQRLIDLLWAQEYRVIGPQIASGAIVYDELRHQDELPMGWTEEQSAGKYRLRRREDDQQFGYNLGPHSWKQYLFPPRIVVGTAQRDDRGWQFEDPPQDTPAYAFLGVRACELAAITVQDRTMIHDQYTDPIYAERRQRALIIAVNCSQAASTCFCTSMDTGPRCRSGFDLALTELDTGFMVEIGSTRGAQIVETLSLREARHDESAAADERCAQAVAQISKRLDTTDIRDLLLNNLEHSRWNEVAQRCLSCTNCTLVCPTCFCCSVSEVSDLQGDRVERLRQWDSCFNGEISYMNGDLVRRDIRSRYRQWLTHKLATWHDQFDSSGCVGCGRCITWCPVGIDLTEEVAAIREDQP